MQLATAVPFVAQLTASASQPSTSFFGPTRAYNLSAFLKASSLAGLSYYELHNPNISPPLISQWDVPPLVLFFLSCGSAVFRGASIHALMWSC